MTGSDICKECGKTIIGSKFLCADGTSVCLECGRLVLDGPICCNFELSGAKDWCVLKRVPGKEGVYYECDRRECIFIRIIKNQEGKNNG